MTTSFGYSAVLILHVLFSVVGFGALTATGTYASIARRATDPYAVRALRNYFRPGHNLAAMSIFLVPLLGGVLLWMGRGRSVGELYPWIGLFLWSLATGLAMFLVFPTEREIQSLLARSPDGDDRRRLARICRRCEIATVATTAIFLVALIDMIARPS